MCEAEGLVRGGGAGARRKGCLESEEHTHPVLAAAFVLEPTREVLQQRLVLLLDLTGRTEAVHAVHKLFHVALIDGAVEPLLHLSDFLICSSEL